MRGLKEMLLLEERRLSNIIIKAKNQLNNSPEGALRISKDKKKVQYYHHKEHSKNKNGEYLSKQNIDLIQQLAQKAYLIKVLKLAEHRLKQIGRILKEYQDDEIENVYRKESIERRQLIQPIEPTWEEFVEYWENQSYTGKGFKPDATEIYTDRGERVRSKTERAIANYLYHHNIPYKYEKPLYLKGYGVVYPDLTCLSRKTRSEIYWEHVGMLDDPAYSRKTVKKILLYEKNGIFVGEKLIQTFETSQTVLNNDKIEMLVNRYLL